MVRRGTRYCRLTYPRVDAPGETWAELGAGSGVFTAALSALLGPDGTVYATDRDIRAVKRLQALKTSGAALHVQRADFTRPRDLSNLNDLDGVLLANALHFVPRQKRVLQQLAQMLRPGGRPLVVEYDTFQRTPWGPFPLPPERLQRSMQASGLDDFSEVGRQPSRFSGRELYAAVALRYYLPRVLGDRG